MHTASNFFFFLPNAEKQLMSKMKEPAGKSCCITVTVKPCVLSPSVPPSDIAALLFCMVIISWMILSLMISHNKPCSPTPKCGECEVLLCLELVPQAEPLQPTLDFMALSGSDLGNNVGCCADSGDQASPAAPTC